jgi:hypothetical protein
VIRGVKVDDIGPPVLQRGREKDRSSRKRADGHVAVVKSGCEQLLIGIVMPRRQEDDPDHG